MSALSAISGVASLLGGSGLFKGKKQEYTSGRSPQAQGIENQMSQYISGGLGKPTAYANVNPMAINAMDMISRMFMGKGYAGPQYGMSAPGGGPTGQGIPPGYGQYGAPPQPPPNTPDFMGSPRMSPQMAQGGGMNGMPPNRGGWAPPQGMPPQMGPQVPPQMTGPGRQFYGAMQRQR
jgi:hypothetical protein